MRNELEDFISPFETAQESDVEVDLAGFLPIPGHPLYRIVLTELIRIDLEYGWRRGRPKPLESYQSSFPHHADDPEVWAQIAFEEYRQRRQAGENASPEDYRSRLGSIVDGWPYVGMTMHRPARASASVESGSAWLVKTRVLDQPAPEAAHTRSRLPKNGKTPGRDSDSYGAKEQHGEPSRVARQPGEAKSDRPARPSITMPEAGDDFLNFRLMAELGRGAFGRVFLAEQTDLAGRRVALKISTNLFSESQTLAQLQHTNIVPIYSAHRADPFQALCMPYLGSTTLADVLASFRSRRSLPVSGKDLVSTLNQRKNSTLGRRDSVAPTLAPGSAAGEAASHSSVVVNDLAAVPAAEEPVEQIALKKLEELSYVHAVLWIGSRLADGLAHAHEHQVIHRDLKPANVLLGDDGQPLLLDFNLSDNARLQSGSSGGSVGGTLPYMAPEHLQSFRNGGRGVDARSDIYSLGLILFELLTAKTPFPIYKGPVHEVVPAMIADRKKASPRVRPLTKAVSPAVESIVRHCLEPDPARRYQSARDLQEDLERQLANRPLRFAPEPSLRERARKWARRHPRLTSSTSVALLAIAMITTLAVTLVIREDRLARFQALDSLSGFRTEMSEAQFLLYGRNADRAKLDRGIDRCRHALERYQVLDNPDWNQLAEVRKLPSSDRMQLRSDIGETLFLAARATFLRAVYRPNRPDRDEIALAFRLNRSAEQCYEEDNVPRALWQQRAELLKHLGKAGPAEEILKQAEKTPLRTARDCYLAAHLQAQRGNFRAALPLLEEAVQKDPQSFSAWFVRANCHGALFHHAEAIACYSTCIALRPSFHWSWFNRGLAHLQLQNYPRAVADFDQAIALQPDLADAYLNRGLAHEGRGHYAEAIRDLTEALALGTSRTQVYFLRAAVRDKNNDREGARRDREEGMRLKPVDEQSWVARGLARLPEDPKGAMADFDAALEVNPRSFPALQNKSHVLADHLRDDRGAVKVLDTIVSLFPDSAMARAGRGVSLARLGERKKALADAEESLLMDIRPPNLYQVACIYALTSRHNAQDRLRAFELLSYALKAGFGLDIVDGDSDLDPIRKTPEYRRIVEAARHLHPPSRFPITH